tara:strand:- start:971 stop:1633 length:663 start_codon:yes stop_codon:yes gene_type:complete
MAELFYRRLMSVADDFGRYYADPDLLLSDCYPIRPSWADRESMSLWMQECEQAGLITIYESKDTVFLEIGNFGQRVKEGQSSKFPENPGLSRKIPENPASRARPSPSPTTQTTPNTNSEEISKMTPDLDEQFVEFRRLYRLVGNPIDEDFADGSFCWRAWNKLDFFQRSAVINSLMDRNAAGVSVMHKPDNYLIKLEWKRAIAKPSNSARKGIDWEEVAR